MHLYNMSMASSYWHGVKICTRMYIIYVWILEARYKFYQIDGSYLQTRFAHIKRFFACKWFKCIIFNVYFLKRCSSTLRDITSKSDASPWSRFSFKLIRRWEDEFIIIRVMSNELQAWNTQNTGNTLMCSWRFKHVEDSKDITLYIVPRKHNSLLVSNEWLTV